MNIVLCKRSFDIIDSLPGTKNNLINIYQRYPKVFNSVKNAIITPNYSVLCCYCCYLLPKRVQEHLCCLFTSTVK